MSSFSLFLLHYDIQWEFLDVKGYEIIIIGRGAFVSGINHVSDVTECSEWMY